MGARFDRPNHNIINFITVTPKEPSPPSLTYDSPLATPPDTPLATPHTSPWDPILSATNLSASTSSFLSSSRCSKHVSFDSMAEMAYIVHNQPLSSILVELNGVAREGEERGEEVEEEGVYSSGDSSEGEVSGVGTGPWGVCLGVWVGKWRQIVFCEDTPIYHDIT